MVIIGVAQGQTSQHDDLDAQSSPSTARSNAACSCSGRCLILIVVVQDVEAAVGADAWKARLASPYAHSRAALDATRLLWHSAYPGEPFDLDMTAAAHRGDHQMEPATDAACAADDDSRMGYNIVLAAQRQGIFYYDVRSTKTHAVAKHLACCAVLSMPQLQRSLLAEADGVS